MTDPDPSPLVYIVDDDHDLGAAVARLLQRNGYTAHAYTDPARVVALYEGGADHRPGHCIVTDIMMGDMDGFGFADAIRARDQATALIFMTAWPTTANAVDAIRRYGGLDYLEKPIDEERLLAAVAEGCGWSEKRRRAMDVTSRLTPREKEVLRLLVQGRSNKMIAGDLGLSPKTIEDHRAAIMTKTAANGLAQLIEITRDGF